MCENGVVRVSGRACVSLVKKQTSPVLCKNEIPSLSRIGGRLFRPKADPMLVKVKGVNTREHRPWRERLPCAPRLWSAGKV